MTPETQTTISVALSQMYDKGIDHAIETVKESIPDGWDSEMYEMKMVKTVLTGIIEKLQNLKAKG